MLKIFYKLSTSCIYQDIHSYLKNSDPHRLEKNTLKTVFFKNILSLPHRDFNLHFIVKCEVGVQVTDIFVDRQRLNISSFTWFNLIHNPSITKREYSRVFFISSNQGQSIIFLHGETNPRYSRLFSILELLATGSLHQPLCCLQETYILVTKVNVTTSTKVNVTRI